MVFDSQLVVNLVYSCAIKSQNLYFIIVLFFLPVVDCLQFQNGRIPVMRFHKPVPRDWTFLA